MEASALHAPAAHGPAALGRRPVSAPLLRLRSDEQLVALFRAGHEGAFDVIHDRYRQRLFSYARQMLAGSRADAEDAMQDVFLRAYRALRVDERPVSLRAWLYRVAHNRCIDHLRRPTPVAADVYDLSRTPLHDPIEVAERREDLARLVADVRRLPDQQRSALLMRELDGLSYAELAAALDTSVPAIKSLLVRARIGLVEAIEARDADCADIRHDLAAAYDRGVRASGRSRRHVRECEPCTRYRTQLAGVRSGFAALDPGMAAPHLLAKLLGLGGAGSGAAAGGGAAVGGGAAAGGAATVSAGKVAVAVCCAAALTGGAAGELPTVATIAGIAGISDGQTPAARARPAARATGPAPGRRPVARTAAAARDSGTALPAASHGLGSAGDGDGLTAPLDAAPWAPPAAAAHPVTVEASGGVAAPDEPAGASAPDSAPAATAAEQPGIVGTLVPHEGEPSVTGSSASSSSSGSSPTASGSATSGASSTSSAPAGGSSPASPSSAGATTAPAST